MFISGISGSYLSERAEQKKNRDELNRAMAIIEKIDIEDEELKKEEEDQIKKAMLNIIRIKRNPIEEGKKKKKRSHQFARKQNGLQVQSLHWLMGAPRF